MSGVFFSFAIIQTFLWKIPEIFPLIFASLNSGKDFLRLRLFSPTVFVIIAFLEALNF